MSHGHAASDAKYFTDAVQYGQWQVAKLYCLGMSAQVPVKRTRSVWRTFHYPDGCAWSQFRTRLTDEFSTDKVADSATERQP